MKYTILLLSLLFFFACNNATTSSSSSVASTENEKQNSTPVSTSKDEIIKSIRAEFTAINSDKGMSKKDYNWENEDYPNCGFIVVNLTKYFSSNGDLCKIIVDLGGDGSNVVYEFYYKNKELFFVYELTKYYPPMENAEPEVSEIRLYVDKGKVIEMLYGKEKSSQKSDFSDDQTAKNMLEMGNDLRDASTIAAFSKTLCE